MPSVPEAAARMAAPATTAKIPIPVTIPGDTSGAGNRLIHGSIGFVGLIRPLIQLIMPLGDRPPETAARSVS
ncbi:hypothetical protein WJ88_02820 [Burkholderia ubonensis]|nr:hypothetical protein WJ88_02820 [Burkholderia ubonensis]